MRRQKGAKMHMEALEYKKTTEDNYFMGLARTQSGLSTDLRRPIGSVIVKDSVVVGFGSNQATLRLGWLQRWHRTRCIRKILGIRTHNFYFVCPGCALFRNHAEARAIRDMVATVGHVSQPYEIYLYGHTYCCSKCEEKMLKLGIKTVYTL